jgi:hypothetical protein
MDANKLAGARLVGVLLLPWLFLSVFSLMFATFLWPRMAGGHLLAIVVGGFVATILVAAVLAAVTFTRDILTGRYPGHV